MMEEKQLVTVILPAAGNAVRMEGIQKTFFKLGDEPVLLRTARLFDREPMVGEIIVVVKEQDLALATNLLSEGGLSTKTAVVSGGATRHASVRNGLAQSNPAFPFVAIHDAARPLCAPADIRAVLEQAFLTGAATLGVPVKDTIKEIQNGEVVRTLPRERLMAIQTPQVFQKTLYLSALAEAERVGGDYTDDCQLIEAIGGRIAVVLGSDRNLKLTTPFDLKVAEALEQKEQSMEIRIGHGYDVHRLVAGRKLILGGVTIPFEKGLEGHSDADVLTHAIMDGLLGGLALGDIGKHFPDTDEQYRGADSLQLLQQIIGLVRQEGWSIGNIDATVLAQAPKLAPYLTEIRQRLADICALSVAQVSVKATTEEGLGFTGSGAGIAVHAVCLLKK